MREQFRKRIFWDSKFRKVFLKKVFLESNLENIFLMMMMMMMMMMNCFCGIVDQQMVFSLIPNQDHCQRSSLLQISDTSWAGFEAAQNLSSDIVGKNCAVVIATTPQRHEEAILKMYFLRWQFWKCIFWGRNFENVVFGRLFLKESNEE